MSCPFVLLFMFFLRFICCHSPGFCKTSLYVSWVLSVELTGLNLRYDVLLSWSLNLNGPGWGDGIGVLVFCRCPSLPPLPVVTSTADCCFLVFGRHVCREPSAVSALNMLRAGPIHVVVTRWYLSQPLQRGLTILRSHYTQIQFSVNIKEISIKSNNNRLFLI